MATAGVGTLSPGNWGLAIVNGTDLPSELAAWEPYGTSFKPSVAIVFYNGLYSTSNTYCQTKYWFCCLTVNSGTDESLVFGSCHVLDANVSTTGIIVANYEMSLGITGSGGSGGVYPPRLYEWYNAEGKPCVQIGNLNSNADPFLGLWTTAAYNAGKGATVSLDSNVSVGSNTKGGCLTGDGTNTIGQI